ncbi:hypothetical protein SFSGTM_07390 [Sulfuriferula nivalis]|uniref:Tle cognate immunity protein 4 C-terminal domain-containing protein n=2 Tax=Sulfuriferula nivalis TaxID=2675298 RepID=A0A809RMK7_9PROT|nr:hypothetical protein SFSGTM_07390 [Sulfuriferula nivalis]
MTELTKNMQPVCVGRFVIAIPTVARIKGWDQNVDRTKIEIITPPSTNKRAFDTKTDQQIAALKTSPSVTDGYSFKDKTQLTQDSNLLTSYNDSGTRYASGGILYNLDAFFWQPALEIKFHTSTTDKYLETGVARITNVVKSFAPIPTTEINNLPAGLCIEKGMMMGSTVRPEEVAVSGRIDQYPGVTFSFSTRTSGQPHDGPTMIQRIDHSFGLGDWMGKEVSASSTFLRKGKRTLNGQKGEEMVIVFSKDGETRLSADAEFYPAPNTLDKPIITVSLNDQTHDDNTHKPYNKNLTKEEFLALWDALLDGIKLRPGAI